MKKKGIQNSSADPPCVNALEVTIIVTNIGIIINDVFVLQNNYNIL